MSRHAIPDVVVRRLAQLLLERVGLRPAAESETGLRMAVRARMGELGIGDAAVYLSHLESGADELRALLPLVTVGKTEFFRDSNQFKALRNQVVPQLLGRARAEMRRLKVWSAGCATGEEPYSLAMLASELGVEPAGLDLLATDVNPAAIERARLGRFSARRLEGVPPELLSRYFVASGDHYEARPELKALVRFEVHNLAAQAFPAPVVGGSWDVVLCRNVIIYFDGPTTAKVIGRFFEALAPGGFLCLGYSESLYRISDAFELVEIDNSFLYRKPQRPLERPKAIPREEAVARLRKEVEALRSAPARHPVRPPRKPEPVLAPPSSPRHPPRARARTSSQEAAAAADPVGAAAALVENGAFEKGIRVLESALEKSPGNLALLLTLGNVLTVMGRHPDALRSYRAALAAEPLCAEAHLFLGIALAEAGAADAGKELTRALFLDPKLALGHYYLGRLAEREGDKPGALRAYRNAVAAARELGASAPLLGYFPDLPADPRVISRAAQYALAALEES